MTGGARAELTAGVAASLRPPLPEEGGGGAMAKR